MSPFSSGDQLLKEFRQAALMMRDAQTDRASAVSAAARSRCLAETYGAGLGEGPPGTADAQGSDAATGLAGRTREPPGRLRLQPILRFVPAVAEEARSGAAARTPRRREDVRRLRRGHDSDSRSP